MTLRARHPALRRLGAGVLATAISGLAAAEGQPAARPPDASRETVTFVVPFSPGGGGDTIARALAQPFAAGLGATVVVENRPGAGGNLGTASVARAEADGRTLVFGTMGTMGTNHALYKKPGYTPQDFEPVALFGATALALVVGPGSSLRTVGDLLAQGRRQPGQLSCASGGNGTVSHLACGLLSQATGIEFNHVPYKAASAAYIDLMAGRVSFMVDVLPPLVPQISGGKLRALAVSTRQRVPALPDTPTIAETVPGYEISSWDGLFAPRGTPAERLDRLHAAVGRGLASPEFQKAMASRGYTLATMPRKEFAEFVRQEQARMGEAVRRMGISLD